MILKPGRQVDDRSERQFFDPTMHNSIWGTYTRPFTKFREVKALTILSTFHGRNFRKTMTLQTRAAQLCKNYASISNQFLREKSGNQQTRRSQ